MLNVSKSIKRAEVPFRFLEVERRHPRPKQYQPQYLLGFESETQQLRLDDEQALTGCIMLMTADQPPVSHFEALKSPTL